MRTQRQRTRRSISEFFPILAWLKCVLIVGSVGASVAGCASTGTIDGPLRIEDGLELEMTVERPGRSRALYRVDANGEIGFAGGDDTLTGELSWTAPLTAAQQDELHRLLDAHPLSGVDLHTPGKPQDLKTVVRIKSNPDARWVRFSVIGENEYLTPLRKLLERFASGRHDAFLKKLPRPSKIDNR